MDKKKLYELDNLLLDHCYNMTILKRDAPKKKKETILNEILAPIIRSNLELEDIKNCISDVMDDKVIDLTFFENGGNLFEDYVNEKWVTFAKNLFKQRSIGLGTPNEASGEGELMFLFLSPKTTKPTKGDIQIGDKKIELKGEQVRVFGDIRGKDFRKKTVEIAKSFGLEPNKGNITNLEAVELEKQQHLEHWKKELSKLNLEKQKKFVKEWLGCLDGKQHDDSTEKIFSSKVFEYPKFIKEIIKILYAATVEKNDFDKFVYLGDGTDSIVLSNNLEEFNERVDDGRVIFSANYFRINQSMPVGLYLKFSH